MGRYAVFLRAVNVGGTGKLAMADLRDMCRFVGCTQVQTLLASGNAAVTFDGPAPRLGTLLEAALQSAARRPVPVMIRDPVEMAAIVAGNPFAHVPGNKVVVILLDEVPAPQVLTEARYRTQEELALGAREIYVNFPQGQGASRLVLPGAQKGTGRNMNTILRMAQMVAD